jgi:DNA-binding response OmpR family regulator
MVHLLIVSSDTAFVSGLATEVAKNGWEFALTADVTAAMRALYEKQPAAIVLDAALGHSAIAWTIFSRLREVCETPILVFARDDSEDARIDALRRGADDAVSHTCTAAEIVMRLRNLSQHHAAAATAQTQTYCDGPLSYDTLTRSLIATEKSVQLTPSESRLLLRFLREPDRLLTNAELAAALWDTPRENQLQVAKVYIHRLRNKLRSCYPQQQYIKNRRAIGYKFS